MRWIWLVAVLVTSVWAQDIRASLTAAYARSERAARYKFVDGLLSNRAAGFQLFGPDGLNRDLTLERERFRALFVNATRVRFKTELLKVVPGSAGAQAEVAQSLQVEQVDGKTHALFTLVMRTRAIDTWAVTPLGWRLVESKVLAQDTITGGPLRGKLFP